jgi:hypothetical protein
MTAQRDFDRQLAGWFEEQSTASMPDGLLSRSLTRASFVRQRPAVLTRDAYAQPWVGPRHAPLAAPAFLLLIALLFVALVVAGSRLLETRLDVDLPAPTAQHATIASAPAPTVRPTPVDTRAPAVPASLDTFATVLDIAPFGDVAWVSTREAIYRTEDAGRTWRAVQPQGWIQASSDAFVDATTAYVPVGGGPAIAVTHDGGASWRLSVLDIGVAPGEPVLSAASRLDAWATYVDPNHFDKKDGTGLVVFATTDGGVTWNGPAHGLQPYQAASSGKLYPANKQFLLNVPGKFDSKPFENFFDISTNGGVTWTRYTFPISKISPKADMKGVGDIIDAGNGHFIAVMGASPDGPGVLPGAVYESTDDPAAWQLLYTQSYVGDMEIEFLTPSIWMDRSSAPSQIRTTMDSGNSWQTVIPAESLYYAQFDKFGSPSTGWLTIECRWLPTPNGCDKNQGNQYLFVTTDGGATWTQVGA